MYEIGKEKWKETLQVKDQEKQTRNYRIYLQTEQVYDDYFHHGIWGKDEALEGIIFFTNQDERSKQNENTLEELVQNSKAMMTQFYRFIDLNDEDKIPDFYKLEKERGINKKIEERIRKKIQQLQGTNDDYVFISNRDRAKYKTDDKEIKRIKEEKQVQVATREKIKDLEITLNRNIQSIDSSSRLSEDEKRKQREKAIREFESKKRKIEQKIRENFYNSKKLKIDENQISYSVRERARYAHFPEYSLEDDMQPYIIRHWTENIYDILKYLQTLEQNDKIEYYKIWLNTRIQRLKNRIEFQSEEKKKEIKQEIQALEETKKKIEAIQEKRKGHEER